MGRLRLAAGLGMVAVTIGGCSGAHAQAAQQTKVAGFRFVPASPELRTKCRTTARRVGYAVPCPTRVPAGLAASDAVGPTGCALDIVGPGGIGGCARSWRGWVVGSSGTVTQHLVITASPHPLRSYAKVVNGPAWYPAARIRPLGRLTIGGWHMREVFVPAATNDGSAFAHHVVLIWTVDGHTYAIGFHDFDGLKKTLALDVALARGVELVQPPVSARRTRPRP